MPARVDVKSDHLYMYAIGQIQKLQSRAGRSELLQGSHVLYSLRWPSSLRRTMSNVTPSISRLVASLFISQ